MTPYVYDEMAFTENAATGHADGFDDQDTFLAQTQASIREHLASDLKDDDLDDLVHGGWVR